jgi:hypothetical protein
LSGYHSLQVTKSWVFSFFSQLSGQYGHCAVILRKDDSSVSSNVA